MASKHILVPVLLPAAIAPVTMAKAHLVHLTGAALRRAGRAST